MNVVDIMQGLNDLASYFCCEHYFYGNNPTWAKSSTVHDVSFKTGLQQNSLFISQDNMLNMWWAIKDVTGLPAHHQP